MNKKSDFQKFCRTNWIMFKYDILPWIIVIGLLGAGISWANKRYAGKFKEKIEMINSQKIK